MPAIADPVKVLAAGEFDAAPVEVDANLVARTHRGQPARMFVNGGSVDT
jgi:hypothetical protein